MKKKVRAVLEAGVVFAASAMFATAVGIALHVRLEPLLGDPKGRFVPFVGASIAFLLASVGLRARRLNSSVFVPAVFEVLPFEVLDDELILTDEERLAPSLAEPLELDDVLAAVGPDSRVVRLFDRRAMPTPGQLRSRIDEHLTWSPSPALPDASQALSDALAELRRSLR